MPNKRQTVTIQDVARAAGVSVSTVSRVINDKVDVASDTQERVLAVIDEMGYTSNLAARSMRSHRKNLVGLVVPDIGFPYSIEILKGINRAIYESNFDLLVYTTGGVQKAGSVSREQYYVSLLNNSLTDGVIIVASAAEEFHTNSRIVSVDPHVVNPQYPSVQGTNYLGAREAMDYLLNLGHTRIGFISGRPEIGSAVRRLQAYKDALNEAGIAVDESLIASSDFTTEDGQKQALVLLKQETPPTAIFAANDQTAIGVYEAAEKLGLIIPDDLSVIGFDNISEAAYLGLTTVDQFLEEMGYVAVQMLIKMINGKDYGTEVHKMETKLVLRSSCKALH